MRFSHHLHKIHAISIDPAESNLISYVIAFFYLLLKGCSELKNSLRSRGEREEHQISQKLAR